MAVVGAGGDEIGSGLLREFFIIAALHVLEHFNPCLPAPGADPAEAQAGGEHFVQRGAMNHIAGFVPSLQCLERCFAVAEGAVGVIFDQGNVLVVAKLDQAGLVVVRHDAAERILQVRDNDQRLDRPTGLCGQFKRFD